MPPENLKSVPAIENAVKILRYLAQSGRPDGVAGTARATGLSVSSAFNILRTLAHEELVSFDPATKTYSIGMGMIGLVNPLLGASPFDVIRPAVTELADELKVMIALWQVTENERIILQHSAVSDLTVHISMRQGARLPAHIGAFGRCYAAATGIGKEEARARFAELRWQVAPDFEEYWADVEACRTTGYAFDYGNLYKGMSIAATLCCDREGHPRMGLSSINISGQISRKELGSIARSLKALAGRIEENVFAWPARPPDRTGAR